MKKNIVKQMSKGDWHGTLLPPTATIKDAIRILNDVSLRIVLVVNPKGKLEGTVSDGDIRRAMLRGRDLQTPLSHILHRNPLVVTSEHGTKAISKLMLINEVQQIPIVDGNRRVIGLHLWDRLHRQTVGNHLMVIMAGGEGKRLRPYTIDRPKPMVEVAGKPILEHILLKAKEEGFCRFAISVRYLGGIIEKYFGTGKQWGVEIVYLRERNPLGTAGAIKFLKPRPNQPFLVTNGDVLADFNYGDLLDFHRRHSAKATMAVRAHDWQNPYGVVKTKGIEIIGFQEKPIVRSQINAGVYVLSPEVIPLLNRAERCDMPELFVKMQAKGLPIIAYPLHEFWLDIGEPKILKEAFRSLTKK